MATTLSGSKLLILRVGQNRFAKKPTKIVEDNEDDDNEDVASTDGEDDDNVKSMVRAVCNVSVASFDVLVFAAPH